MKSLLILRIPNKDPFYRKSRKSMTLVGKTKISTSGRRHHRDGHKLRESQRMIVAELGVQGKYELWKLPIIGAEVGKLSVGVSELHLLIRCELNIHQMIICEWLLN